ncbi:MAG TPA: DbpA RNA binding domain-containing protein, partial [Sphingobacterium sp.]|nr:DbpA RNA binding domain-containing protein [Sphingobacterium sp.]
NSNRILITTDLAARGLDIPEIDTIIHYQLPAKEDAFTHRNGRTARMHAKGEVVLMLKPDDNFLYLPDDTTEIVLDEEYPLPPNTTYATLYLPLGRKDKVNKIDIVGYLLRASDLNKEDIGLIEVKDKETFIAVRREVATRVIKEYSDGKIKGKKVKFYRT